MHDDGGSGGRVTWGASRGALRREVDAKRGYMCVKQPRGNRPQVVVLSLLHTGRVCECSGGRNLW